MENKKKRLRKKPMLFQRTIRLLLKNKKHFFLYQLLYALIAVLCIFPLTETLMRIARKKSSYSYITTENLLDFLCKPVTIFAVLCLIFVIGFFVLWEISLVYSFLLVGKRLDKKPGIYVFLGSIHKALYGWKGKNILTILLSYCFLIGTNITVVVGIFTRTRIPSYIVKSIVHLPMMKMVIGLVVFVIVLIAYRNLFTLSYFLLERKTWKESRKSCAQLMKGHRIHSFFCFLLWNIGVGVMCVAIYVLLMIAEAVFVILFVNKTTAVAVFLTLCEHANIYAGFCLAWFGLYANLGLGTELFIRYKKINEEEFQTDEIHVAEKVLTDKRKRIIALILVIGVFLVDGLYTRQNILSGRQTTILSSFDGIKITAHRGSSSEAPENTLPAIQAAIDSLADYVEFDVQQTMDGEIVILHDSNLRRTSGHNEFIWNMTFEELRQLDMGGWFSESYAGTQIPTLEEAIALCKGKIRMNIEIKANSHFKDLEEKVVALLQKYDVENQCVIQSTEYSSLVKVKSLDDSITTGLILMGAYGEFEESKMVDFFSIRSTFVNRNMVESAHKNGKAVYAWTVNTKNEIRRMKVLKVDNIITDRPILARELLYQEDFNMTFMNLFKLLNN